MAIRILQGDKTAASALAEKLVEDKAFGVQLPPVHHITVHTHRLRVVIHYPIMIDGNAIEVDTIGIAAAVENWLEYGEPLILVGADRIELFEMSQ